MLGAARDGANEITDMCQNFDTILAIFICGWRESAIE